jgi:LemA protein
MTIYNIIAAATLGSIILSALWCVRLFNRLVKLKTLNEEGWSGILAALKHRRDLIPNLVETASGYMGHESETLKNVIQARAMGQAARGFSEVMDAETHMMSALAGFRVLQENYPQLKADANMMQIQEKLSELEERIEKTRRYYNATVRDLNMAMDRFPANIIAGTMGFKHAAFFDIDEQSREAPEVRFSNRSSAPPERGAPAANGIIFQRGASDEKTETPGALVADDKFTGPARQMTRDSAIDEKFR